MRSKLPISLIRTSFYLFSILFFLPISFAEGQQFSCTKLNFIEIKSPDNTMIKDICTASSQALSFLSNYIFLPKRIIKIHIVDNTIDNNGYLAFGSYDRQSDLILLTSFTAISRGVSSPQIYDQPFDRELYFSAIAHEIAHAVFQHNTQNVTGQLTNAAQEYLAHATQLGVLSKERREVIIKTTNVGPWESGDSISVTYMGLNPTGFAVKSYLHLIQMEDPQPFFKLLLNNNWYFISFP